MPPQTREPVHDSNVRAGRDAASAPGPPLAHGTRSALL